MELPKRKQNRLKEYDYSTPNAYFITVCTQERKNLFWMNTPETVDCPENVPLTKLGELVKQAICDIPKRYPTISMVVNQTKGAVSKMAGGSIWQKGFYDHVIRGEQDYLDVWNYIEGNPGKWKEDKLYIAADR